MPPAIARPPAGRRSAPAATWWDTCAPRPRRWACWEALVFSRPPSVHSARWPTLVAANRLAATLMLYTQCCCVPLRPCPPHPPQGIFVNFKDLLYYNGSKLPFAAAQVKWHERTRCSAVHVADLAQQISQSVAQLWALHLLGCLLQCPLPAPHPLPFRRSAAATVTRSRRARACCACASSRRRRLSTLSTPRTRWGAGVQVGSWVAGL